MRREENYKLGKIVLNILFRVMEVNNRRNKNRNGMKKRLFLSSGIKSGDGGVCILL